MLWKEGLWSNLPADLLHIILSRLPLFYHSNFASVCKNWNAVCTHKLYRIQQTDPHPLLVYVEDWKSGIINYYSPVWNKNFKVKCPLAVSKSRFFSSKDGWLVVYKNVLEKVNEVEVVLYNPATNVTCSYPGLQHDFLFTGITFSGCPDTRDFVIFGIASLEEWANDNVWLTLWKEGRWKLQSAPRNNQSNFFMSPYSSPVVHKGCFYCVGETGKLGVFNPQNETWNIFTHPKGFSVPTSSKEVYLIESEDSIKAVVGGNHDPRVLFVFFLNHEKMVWEKKYILDTQSVFIGPKASIMIDFKKTVYCGKKGKIIKKLDAIGKAMKNRAYTARFYGNTEAVEAKMEISERRLFFITEADDHSKNKDELEDGNMLSYNLQHPKTSKCQGSSQYLYCAWYKPENYNAAHELKE